MSGFHTRSTMPGMLKVPLERVLLTIVGDPQIGHKSQANGGSNVAF